MATSEILASGTAAARSSTLALASGESRTLILRAVGPTSLPVQIQASDSSWVTIGQLDTQNPARQVYGPGTYSVYRDTQSSNVGIDAAS